MLATRAKLALVTFFLESFFICVILYHVLIRDHINTRRRLKGTEVDCEGGVCSGDEMLVKTLQQGYDEMQKDLWSQMNKLLMNNCPRNWPLEVVRMIKLNDTRPPAQVCRNIHGGGEWKCAPGWAAQEDDPFCVRMFTQPLITNNPKETHKSGALQKTRNAYVQLSEKFHLLFVHIPYTGGTAIEQSLLFNETIASLQQDHYKAKLNFSSLKENRYKSYHKFCIVRHPCARLISAWKYFSRGPGIGTANLWAWRYLNNSALTSFEAFVEQLFLSGGSKLVDSQSHLQSEVKLIFDETGRFLLDHVLVYERWRESINKFSEAIHVNTSTLLPQLKNSSENSCEEMYSSSTWSKMTNIYTMDFCVLGYSRNRSRTHSSPTVRTNIKSLSRRFQYCKRNVENNYNQQKQTQIRNEVNTTKSCLVYTYFQTPPNATKTKLQLSADTIRVWKNSWSRAGWTPRVLTEEDAKRHPEYEMFREKFLSLPTTNPKAYEMSCFMRHVAMAAVGGGWMTDYDILPLHIPACIEPLNMGRYTVYQLYVPSLVSGSGDEFTRVAKLMANIDWQKRPQLSSNGLPHVSDMHLFNLFIKVDTVISMMAVIEAEHYFEKPFICNKSCPRRSRTPIPPELPQLPWVMHFSHSSLGFWVKNNITSIWPGSSWNAKNLKPVESVRPMVMKDAFDFIEIKCQYRRAKL
ncbi:hypothetical protein HOLleu_13204 [Holothuria leucospilota]|uniref:Uncharacterized protein n=1 Tax=Holothuria leucospilota TaxID=206669 RepID=A0A9Q1CC62_HOLLE|nr:hypothetical protein HOLleu_13204 [Holothuria leucospilota]